MAESTTPAAETETKPTPAAETPANQEAPAAKETATATPEKAPVKEAPAKEVAEKKAAPAAAPAAEAPAAPTFNSDALQQSTSRMTHRAWHLFQSYKADVNVILNKNVRASITARSLEGAQELAQLLKEQGNVTEYSLRQKTIELTTTYPVIQLIVKHPQFHLLDAVAIQ